MSAGRTEPPGHLSPEDLADVDAVAGHEHLRHCADCRTEWQQQRAVRDLLRALPEPGAMPTEVAGGLHEALGRLSPDDVERPARADRPAAGATVVPMGTRSAAGGPGDRLRPLLAVAAAVIVLGGGGAAAVTHPWTSGEGATSGSDTAASASKEAGEGAAGADASQVVVQTGTDYDRDELGDQVSARLLNVRQAEGARPSPLAADAAGDTRLATPEGLSSCLAALGVDPGSVAAVDLARFDGDPAAVIVLRHGGAQDVWVVGRGCRQGDDQTRYFARLE